MWQGLCCRFAITAATIARDDRDRGMSSAVAGSRSGSMMTTRRLSKLQKTLAYQ